MPRAPRIQVAGGIYHVTTRGNRRQAIGYGADDYDLLVKLTGRVSERHEWKLHAFCVMPNHVHLLVTTPEPNISAGMCALNGQYARAFNERHRLTGHVFERRFHGRPIERESHLLEASRYVALNPVRAGLCDRPEEWPWSSYSVTLEARPGRTFLDLDWLPELFETDLRAARLEYRRFVESALATFDVAA